MRKLLARCGEIGSLCLVLAALSMAAWGQTISGGGGGTPVPPVVNGLCLIGSGGQAIWGSCSGAGTAVTSVTGTVGQITVAPTTGAAVFSLPATITSNQTFSGTVNMTGPFQLGGVALALPVTVAQGGTGSTTAAAARTALGLGTSATVNTGTSGATLGLLNGNLIFGGTLTLSNTPTITTLGGGGTRVLSVDNTGLLTAGAAGGTVQSGTGPALAQYPAGTGTAVGPVTLGKDATIDQSGNLTLANNATARSDIGLGTADSPTHTGLTLSGLAGTGARCVHVNATGVFSPTAGDCAAGGSGSVTDVNFSVPAASIFTATGGHVTTVGTLGFTTAVTSGGVLYGSDAVTVSSSPAGAANTIMLWGGAGTAPTGLAAGTTITVLHGNGAGAPTFSAVALATDVTGTLGAANMLPLATGLIYQGDGSNRPAATAFATVMDTIGSTRGSIAERGVGGWVGLVPGAAGQVLTSNGPGTDPSYQAASGGVSSVTGTAGELAFSPTTGAVVGSLPATITTNKTFSGTINMSGVFQIGGAPFALPVSVAQGGTGSTTAATARTALGLGTAATANTGTSGATLGLLNSNLTFGGTLTISPFAGGGTRILGVDNTGLITAGAVGGTVQSGTGPALAQYPSGTGTAVGPVTLAKDATIDQSGNLTLANNATARSDLGLGTTDSPTFAGLTLTALAGSGARCVHVDATGLFAATAGDCAAGGASGVTSVSFQVPASSIFTASPAGPVTTSGALGFTTAVTSGGVLYGSSATQVASSGAGAAGAMILWGGPATAPTAGPLGTTITVLHGNAAGAPTFAAVALATDVSGTLGAANMLPLATGLIYQGDGSNRPAATAFATVMDAIGSTRGAIPERGATGWTALAPGTAGQVLTSNGAGTDPTYQTPATGAVSSVNLTVPASSIFGVTGGGAGAVSLGLTTTVTSGGILYGSSGTQVASSGAGTANRLVLWGGAATAPGQVATLGTATTVLHGAAAGPPTFAAVALGTDVSGTLPAANMLPLTLNQLYLGNASSQPVSSTLTAAIDAAIGSTRGALLTRQAAGWALLAPGTNGNVLTSAGAGADPLYSAPGGTPAPATLTDGSTIPVDLTPSDNYSVTEAACNRTYANPTNGIAGRFYAFTRTIALDCPNNVITWGSAYLWPGGTSPTLSTANGQRDKFVCQAFAVSGANVTAFDCSTPLLAYAKVFQPTDLVTLRLWVDFADHNTTFTAANCTGGLASTDGAVIGSVRDKSPDASCWNATGSPVLHSDANNHWWMAPTGTSYFTGATGTGAAPTTIGQNRVSVTAFVGAQFVATTTPQTVFLMRTGTGSNTRFSCGFNLLAAGAGPGLAARSLDADAQQSLAAGSESGLTATPLSVDCNANYANASYWLNTNNGTATNFIGGTAANTSNTASTVAPTIGAGGAGASPLPSGTRVYQVIVYTPPADAKSEQSLAMTFVCQRMGTTC